MTSRQVGGLTESFFYDGGTYGKGHLTGFTDSSGSTAYAYGAAGELLAMDVNVNNVVYNTTWYYDAAGRLDQMVYPSGFQLKYHWDDAGRMSQLDGWLNGGWVPLASGFLYQPATDRPYAWRHGNGVARLVTLDTDGRVTALESPGLYARQCAGLACRCQAHPYWAGHARLLKRLLNPLPGKSANTWSRSRSRVASAVWFVGNE